MEQLYVFGTGHAAVTRCYNTCFAIREEGRYFMVDAGGGNGILTILEDMNVDLNQIHDIFVTHKHTDHILGIVWMIRMIASGMSRKSYEGELRIYCHEYLTGTIETLCRLTLLESMCRYIGDQIRLIPVHEGETFTILNRPVTFFDIRSTKAKQYGFSALLKSGKRLTCAGDEPFNPQCRSYAEGCSWLLHEAFCLYSESEIYKPYEKHHSTVKDACQLAEDLGVENLVLWHTEDRSLPDRRTKYIQEGRAYFHGNLYVPDDREILDLKRG